VPLDSVDPKIIKDLNAFVEVVEELIELKHSSCPIVWYDQALRQFVVCFSDQLYADDGIRLGSGRRLLRCASLAARLRPAS